MGGCQSKKAAVDEKVSSSISSPRRASTLLQRLSSPRLATVIPDVEDDFDVEHANLSSLIVSVNHASPTSSPHRIPAAALVSPLQTISPLSSVPDDDDAMMRGNQHKLELQVIDIASNGTPGRATNGSRWVPYSPDISMYTSSSSSASTSPVTPGSRKLRGLEILPPETFQPNLAQSDTIHQIDKGAVFPLQKTVAATFSLATNEINPMGPFDKLTRHGSQLRLRSAARSRFSPLAPLIQHQQAHDDDQEDSVPQLHSIARIGPVVAATEIPEEQDPDAPSDEEDYHELHGDDEDEPGRLIINSIRTKYIPPVSPGRAIVSPTTPWTQTDTGTASVHPQTLSHFHRMALQQKLQQKQINKQARANKLQERIEDVKSYKELYKDFQAMELVAKENRLPPRKSLTNILNPLTPPDKRLTSDSGKAGSASKNITARRSQRRITRSNSFTLGDSSSWYFDFQGTDFAFEGKDDSSHRSLSLLNERDMEAQRKLFEHKRMPRKMRKRDSRSRAHSMGGGGQIFVASSVSSVGTGDYGPVRRRRPSTSGMSAPALHSFSSDVEITNIEVSFSSPNIKRNMGDDASWVSDLADDVSASQFPPEYAKPFRPRKKFGASEASTAEVLAKIEKRLQEFKKHTQVDCPTNDANEDAVTPVEQRKHVTTAESPINAALLDEKFQAAAAADGNIVVAQSPSIVKRLNEMPEVLTSPEQQIERIEPASVVTPTGTCKKRDYMEHRGGENEHVKPDETPRIKNRRANGQQFSSHLVSPEQSTNYQECFAELGQKSAESSVLENSLDESTIAMIDECASISSLHGLLKQQENDVCAEDHVVPIISLRQSCRVAPGSIANMTSEEFLHISEEASTEQQTRKELLDQIRGNVLQIPKKSDLNVSVDEPLIVTPEKVKLGGLSTNATKKVEILEQMLDERLKNRKSLASLRGFEDPSSAEDSLLLAEKVEAKVQDVLCKFREGNLTNVRENFI
ncbi:hypothetical protein MPSEU_000095400 [Mayamaea pseudoterrestris]|nr:hypothetical protein MPSEU_000095400 [Mayamaea pseudoterrestris]